jgi:hypothetical protein
MRKGAIMAVTLLLAAAVLTGCESIVKSGIEQATGVKVDGNQVSVSKDGTTVAIGGSEAGTLPEGFPSDFPMFDPLTINTGLKASSNGATQYTVTAQTASSFDAVQSFYADKLTAAGWTVKKQGTVVNGAGAGTVNGTRDGGKVSVALVQTGPDSQVEIVISLQTK